MYVSSSIIQVNDKIIFQNMKAILTSQNSSGRKALNETVSPGPLLRSDPVKAGCSGPCPGSFYKYLQEKRWHSPMSDLCWCLTSLTVKMFFIMFKKKFLYFSFCLLSFVWALHVTVKALTRYSLLLHL